MAYELGVRKAPNFSKKVKTMLLDYEWPGNIRELKNVIERAVYSCEDNQINTIEFNPFKNPFKNISSSENYNAIPDEKNFNENNSEILNFEDIELNYFMKLHKKIDLFFLNKALKKSAYHQVKAAKLLGLSYDQFRGLYRKYKDKITA